MKKISMLLLVAVLAVVCSKSDNQDYDYKLEVTETRTWSATDITQIDAITKNGNISVSASQDTMIAADITRSCRGEDSTDAAKYIGNVVVTDNVTGGKLTLKADMPNSNGHNYQAHFDISTQESTYLEVNTTNGDVSLDGVIAGAKLQTTNGKVTAENHRGGIDAKSTNGNVDCTLTGLISTESAVMSTTNGDVILYLPSDVSARFDGWTTNGEVTVTGFTSVQYEINENKHKKGQIGTGPDYATVTLSTTNGNVTIRAR